MWICTHAHTETVLLSWLIERNLSQSTSESRTQSELKSDVVCSPSSLAHCCAHVVYPRGLCRPPKPVHFVSRLHSNRCIIVNVSVGF